MANPLSGTTVSGGADPVGVVSVVSAGAVVSVAASVVDAMVVDGAALGAALVPTLDTAERVVGADEPLLEQAASTRPTRPTASHGLRDRLAARLADRLMAAP
ncbi:MAG: hypothetical protein WCO88_02335 [Actinomycetota bacterium]